MGPLLLVKAYRLMDMVIPVIRVRDQVMEHPALMVLDHMGPGQVDQEVHPGNTLAILVRDSIRLKDGMDQIWQAKVVLLRASQVVHLDTLE